MHQNVIISSTVRDLLDYRDEVRDACMRQGMFPDMMEYLPTKDASAIKASLELVDRADIYLGVFAHRYGYIPDGHEISITEMEYNHAVERGIPRLIFLINDDHPVRPADVEKGVVADKLLSFKERLKNDQVVNFFTTPSDLRAHIINSLSQYRMESIVQGSDNLHEVSDIPHPPELYVAHPYVLLQTRSLIGRQAELNHLTDWITKPGTSEGQTRILNIVAHGGMGKSALAWKWVNYIAPQEMKPLAGRMWWSFQDDSNFESFITCALAYVTGHPRKEVEKDSLPEREKRLVAFLDRLPFLLVLDGLERILIAYNLTAADKLDVQAEGLMTVSESVRSAMSNSNTPHRLRRTADPRFGILLRRLASVRASRILISTRLYPSDLQTSTEHPMPGSDGRFLYGLRDDDAVNLWRALGLTGSREALLSLFRTFDNYPLLLQLLAGVVASDRHEPGDFGHWRREHSDFNPFALPLEHGDSQVFELILSVLKETTSKLLHFIAALKMPSTYTVLSALLVSKNKLFANEGLLTEALTELENCGLLGWDKSANRYDLHPVVRGVVWNGLPEADKKNIYETLYSYLDSIPPTEKNQIKRFEDLSLSVELYNTLIGLKRYKDASDLFYNRLNDVTLYQLSAPRQRAALLESLFPDGIEELPCLSDPEDQAFILNALAATYLTWGRPGLAAILYRRHNAIRVAQNDQDGFCVGLGGLSNSLRQSGGLRESEALANQALSLARELKDEFLEAVNLGWLGISLAVRGMAEDGERDLRQALQIFKKRSEAPPEESKQRRDTSAEATAYAFLARIKLKLGDPLAAQPLADEAWKQAKVEHFERYVILTRRMLGAVALALGEQPEAYDHLNQALLDARAANLAVEEVLALIELAELRWRQGDAKAARGLLEGMWELAERGPFPLFHADACNLLAQIEIGEGNRSAAVEAATKAYRLAWCDGPPFTYYWGVQAARAHLSALGVPEPRNF